MRIGTAISIVVHVTLVAVMLVLAGVRPFKSTPAEAITVDIVTEKDAPEKPKFDVPEFNFTDKDKKPDDKTTEKKPVEDKPADVKPAEAKAPDPKPVEKPPEKLAEKKAPEPNAEKKQPEKAAAGRPPQQQIPAPQAALPQPASPQTAQQEVPQASPIPYADLSQKFASIINPKTDNDFDALATTSANISMDAAKALREKLRECSVLPKSVSPNDNVKIVLRVAFSRDGMLAQDPLLIEASASAKGPLLMQSAMKALAACQPYTALPADKYNEWKMLDLSFTPKDFKGG